MSRNKTLRIKFFNFSKTSVSFSLSINRNIKHKINLFKTSFKASKFSLKCQINLCNPFDVELVKYRTVHFIMVFDPFWCQHGAYLKAWSSLVHTM